MTTMNQREVFSLYRMYLRVSKTVFEHSTRSDRTLRNKIREGFEEEGFNGVKERKERLERGYRTLEFLKVASDETSTEQKIVRTLCIMGFYQWSYNLRPGIFRLRNKPTRQEAYNTANLHYDLVIKHLNTTAGLCLR